MFPTEIGTKKIPRNAQYPYYTSSNQAIPLQVASRSCSLTSISHAESSEQSEK